MTTIIGSRYEVIDEIGSGAVGVLYRARDQSLKKTVAIKLLHANQVTANRVIRLQQEARTLCQLSHLNLVSVFDFGLDKSGSPYIVMEYIQGKNLFDYVQAKGKLPLPVALDILIEICRGLDCAHQHGVLHRDLKPSNIMLAGADREGLKLDAKIVDFGLAKTDSEHTEEELRITRSGAVIGSPLYMSPEVGRRSELDRRSDIYSMGCLMFYMLTGNPPFRGDTINDTITMHINQAPPTLSEKAGGDVFPGALEVAVATAIKKNPDDRFQRVTDLQSVLETIRDDLSFTRRDATANFQTPGPEAPRHSSRLKTPVKIAIGTAIAAVLLSLPLVVQEILEEKPSSIETKTVLSPHEVRQGGSAVFDAGKQNFAIFENERMTLIETTYMPYIETRFTWSRGFGTIDDDNFPKLASEWLTPYIRLQNKDVTGKCFSVLDMDRLRGLDVSFSAINNEGMKVISKMNSLQLLVLNKIPELTDNDLLPLTSMNHLRFLALRANKFTDKGVKTISELANLEGLDLTGNASVTENAVDDILTLSKLNCLGIGRTGISKSTLPAFLKQFAFKGLDLSKMKMTDSDLEQLLSEPLTCLNLSGNPISNHGLMTLAKIPTLRHLILEERVGFDEGGILALSAQLPHLVIHQYDTQFVRGRKAARDSFMGEDRMDIAY